MEIFNRFEPHSLTFTSLRLITLHQETFQQTASTFLIKYSSSKESFRIKCLGIIHVKVVHYVW